MSGDIPVADIRDAKPPPPALRRPLGAATFLSPTSASKPSPAPCGDKKVAAPKLRAPLAATLGAATFLSPTTATRSHLASPCGDKKVAAPKLRASPCGDPGSGDIPVADIRVKTLRLPCGDKKVAAPKRRSQASRPLPSKKIFWLNIAYY